MSEPKLHRIHAAPSAGHSLDLGDIRWRPVDGGTQEDKRVQAYRMAFTWNMAEGIPTAALASGCVARFYLAVKDLLDAIRAGEPLDRHVALVQAAYDAHQFDYAEGRLHDCAQCLAGEADAELEDAEGRAPTTAEVPGQGELF